MGKKKEDMKTIKKIGTLMVLGMLVSIMLLPVIVSAGDDSDWEITGEHVWMGTGLADQSGNVGIGTDSPSTKLHVVGDVKIDSGDLNVDSGTLFVNNANNKVGIGTMFPENLLTVGSATDIFNSDPKLLVEQSLGIEGSSAKIMIGNHYLAEDPWFEWQILTGPKLRLNYVDYNSLLSDIMTIQSGGNVGIGESNPQANLHIGRSASAVPGTVARIAIQPYMIQSATWMITARDDWYNAHLDLSNGLTNVLTLRNDGNVGIGNTAPQYDLDIGDGITSANLRIQKAGGGTTASATIGYLGIMSSGTNADTNLINTYEGGLAGYGDITLNPARAGNVGIGTLAPNYKLDLRTGGALYDPNGVEWQQFIGPESVAEGVIGDGIGLRLGFDYDHDGKAGGIAAIAEGGWANNVGLGLFTSSTSYPTPTEKVRITAGGNVGIGDPSPDAHLVVGSDTTMGIANGIGDVYIENDLEVDGNIYMGNTLVGDITAVGSMTTGAAFADSTADGDWLGLGSSAGRIEFDDQAIDEVNILNAKVGIGTTTPNYHLHIVGDDHLASFTIAPKLSYGDNYAEINLADDPTFTDGVKIQYYSTSKSFSIYRWINGAINGQALLSITGVDSKVGIGVNGAYNKLTVNGEVSIGAGYIDDYAPSNGLIVEGNVGIGTPTPDEKLEVEWSNNVDVEIGRGTGDTDVTFIALRNVYGTQCYIYPNAWGDGLIVTTSKP